MTVSGPDTNQPADLTGRPMTKFLPLLVLCSAMLVNSGCRQADPVPISLMDPLDPSEPLGPWRLAIQVRGTRPWADDAEGLGVTLDGEVIPARSMAELPPRQLKKAARVLGKGGEFIQTAPVSSLRTPVTVAGGERLLLGLNYGARWMGDPLIEGRLLRDGEMVASGQAAVHGHWCEVQLTVPPGGAETLEVRHHLAPGTAIVLRNTALVAVNSAATEAEIVRAMCFLRLARGSRATPATRVPEKRVIPLELAGRTLDILLLGSGETREVEVPPALAGRRLLCWYTVMTARPDAPATLAMEAESGEGWRSLAVLSVRAEDINTWTKVSLEKGDVPPDCRRIRLTVAGGDAIVGMSGPVLPAGRRPKNRKNLLVIDLDTLRADRMGTYGYQQRPTTRLLDAKLQQQGFHLFQHAYSPAVSTLPATAKFLAGRYHDIHRGRAVPRGYTLLQEWLRQAGYYCAAFTGGGQLRDRGFEQGFHEFYWSRDVGKIEDSFPQATAWLEENRDELFFLFLHTYEPHAPYTRGEFCAGLPRGRLGDLTAGELLIPKNSRIKTHTPLSEPEMRYMNAAYDGGVKKATDEVALLLDQLDRLGLADSTVVVILSDHGEEFWDHNGLFAQHGQSLYGELLNVPLIIFDPHRPAAGLHRITEEASTVDLLPTVFDLLGLPFTAETDGVSLAPLMAGEINGEAFHREIPVLASRLDKSYCVIRNGVKYIRGLGPQAWLADQRDLPPWEGELFRLTDDPREQDNLAELQPDLQRQMTELLRRAAGQALAPLDEEAVDHGPVSPDLQRQLRALGYVVGK